MWSSKDISIDVKMKFYKTLVLRVLLYNVETWSMKRTQENGSNVFEMSCLRKIVGVTRRDRIRNAADIRGRTSHNLETEENALFWPHPANE